MKPTTITVVANPGRLVPLPSDALRSATGAQVKILPPERAPEHAHELAGKVTLDISAPAVAQYVRRRIAAGDLTAVEPDPPALEPDPPAGAAAPSSPPPPPAASAAATRAKD